LLLLLLTAACQPSGPPSPFRGVVIAVDARSVARADTVTVRADDGREYRLRVDPAVPVTPGHLREHMALGEPVLVEYRREGNELVAIRIDDG
jgi:hypothetical protein